MKAFLCLLVGFGLILVALRLSAGEQCGSSSEDKTTLTKIGDLCPVLSIRTIDDLDVDFHGKVVVLSFFVTWCGTCMAEMPRLEKELWEPFKNKNLTLVSVAREHSQAEIKALRQRKKYSFLFAVDPRREIYAKFATECVPRYILIGKDGRIKYQSKGYAKDEFGGLVQAVTNEFGN